jgi:BlaI family transcriptional regulator, penicillinase repressor
MTKKITKPTEAELEILQVLWENGPSSVRDVHELLATQRDTGYTTTLKLLQIMLDKGLVQRDDTARTHIYEARAKEADVQNALLEKFLESAFRGSASQLILQALGNHTASADELTKIKALIDSIEKSRKR